MLTKPTGAICNLDCKYKYHYNVGLDGKGVVPGRPFDTFGIGWSRIEFSDNSVPFLRQSLGLGLDKEDAVEMYYNASLTRGST